MLGAEHFFQSRCEEGGWDPEGYRQWLMHLFPVTFEPHEFDQDHLDVEQIETASLQKKWSKTFKEKLETGKSKVPAHLIAEGEPPKPAHNAVRNLMIRKIGSDVAGASCSGWTISAPMSLCAQWASAIL